MYVAEWPIRRLTVSRTINHQELIRMLALVVGTNGVTGNECVDEYTQGNVTSIVPYLQEGDTHCSLMIMAPDEVLFVNPYGFI